MKTLTQPLDTLKTAEQFYMFFLAIPDDKWTLGATMRCDGTRCALGHLGVESIDNYIFKSPPGYRLRSILGVEPWEINDGAYPYDRLGDTPKARILAALRDKFTLPTP